MWPRFHIVDWSWFMISKVRFPVQEALVRTAIEPTNVWGFEAELFGQFLIFKGTDAQYRTPFTSWTSSRSTSLNHT